MYNPPLKPAIGFAGSTPEDLSKILKRIDLNLDAEKDLQVDVKTMPAVSTEPSFSDALDVAKKALVDADRHPQVDVLSMPSVPTEPSFSDALDVAKKALVDADRHPQVDVLSSALPTGAATETTLGGVKTGTDKIPTDPAREGGNLAALNTKTGEVSATPTANTILGRLKDIWDRLDILFKSGQAIGSLPAGTADIGDIGVKHRKSIKNVTGTISATTTIVPAVAGKKIKVTAFSLITSSTTAVTCTFKDGVGGTAKWTVPLQALSGTISGANLATTRPDCLFETTAGNALELALSAAISVVYSISYFDDDAT